jgi:hypothetical protein
MGSNLNTMAQPSHNSKLKTQNSKLASPALCEGGTNHLTFLFKTNPICGKPKMNVTKALTTDYENKRPHSRAESKPNPNPIKANKSQ